MIDPHCFGNPSAIASVTSPEEVVAVVEFAKGEGGGKEGNGFIVYMGYIHIYECLYCFILISCLIISCAVTATGVKIQAACGRHTHVRLHFFMCWLCCVFPPFLN